MIETNKPIGELLKEEREKRNLSFADLSKLTKIPAKYLILMEKNRFDFFPAAVVKGFLKVVSWRLKINDKYIFDEFDKLSGKKKIQERKISNFQVLRFTFRLNYFSYIILVIIILSLSSELTRYLYSYKPKPISQVSLSSAPKLIINKKIAENLEKPQEDVYESTHNFKNAPLRLVLDLKDKSWARIIVDGKRVFEGILNPGSNSAWTAHEKIKIRVGNAAAVNGYFNDKPLGVLGEKREIIDKTFEKI